MTYDEFVGKVQHQAKLGSPGDAVMAIQATLQTLAERLDHNEAMDLAAQLPRAFHIYFHTAAHGVRMSLDDFFHRVSEREKVDLPAATYHARVIVDILQDAVSAGEIHDVLSQLPPSWAPLFAGSRGELQAMEAVGKR